MSKRSSRRKRMLNRKKQEACLTGPVLAQQGKVAFDQADYDQALALWGKAQGKPDLPPNLKAAMAEAHFRRAHRQHRPHV